MGALYYGDARVAIAIDDRTLAHLRLVILSRLRRGESFPFSWEKPADEGSGRGTIWLHPSIALAFDFSGSREPSVNKTWIDALLICSMSLAGLRAVDEPPEKHDPVSTPTLAVTDQDGQTVGRSEN
ncbi:ATP-dependent DNA ligase [Lacisediminihabitans sp. H27-G8]|uniref:DUF7882 family protein n=1 Tax=Lacisediminihabitans sp. H27-G8 TaxID=3111909 RepID=UPI0038FCE25D